jgi:hypothetical protein
MPLLMKPVKPLQAGDIIFTDHILIRHYGVYAGKGRVIHYAGENGIFDANIGIREISLEQFTKNSKYGVVQFAGEHTGINRFSGKETVHRARSRLGERSYNLIFNNCEHFALWCKTGKSKSRQVERAVTIAMVLGTIAVAAHLVKSNDEG